MNTRRIADGMVVCGLVSAAFGLWLLFGPGVTCVVMGVVVAALGIVLARAE